MLDIFSLNLDTTGGQVIPPPILFAKPQLWYASYPAFRSTVQQMLDGDDLSTSSLSTQVLDLVISLGEKRVYRDVRSVTQYVVLQAVVAQNSIPMPTDLLEAHAIYTAVSPGRVIRYMPFEQLQTYILSAPRTNNPSQWFSERGDAAIFYPAFPDGTVVYLHYYKQYNSIVQSGIAGNLFFSKYPELFLYAALDEAAPFVGELARAPEWKTRYLQLRSEVSWFEDKRFTRGSKLKARTS